jgi:hypothetical protein
VPAVAALTPPPLPFDLPPREELAASPREVVAYYHLLPLYWRKDRNLYAENICPDGNGGVDRAVGGKWRQRPYPVIDNAGLDDAGRVAIMAADIGEAAAIGIDAFLVNVAYRPTDFRWREQLCPIYAAADDFCANTAPGFRIAVDLSALAISGWPAADQSPQAWADSLAPFLQRPSAYTYAGRPALAVYHVTKLPPSWYEALAGRLLEAHGIDVAILPSYQGSKLRELDPYTYLMPRVMPCVHGWTGPGPQVPPAAMHQSLRAWAAEHGVAVMGSMGQFENDRPAKLKQLDGHGFAIMDNMWRASIEHGDDVVQIVSWNDLEEAHNVRPSTGYQFAPYDLTAYYLTWFKTGAAPTIVRDTLYYAHRMQLLDAPRDETAQPHPYTFRNGAGAPARDGIVTMAFLTAPGTVKVTCGGRTYRHAAPAGVSVFTDPLAAGGAPSFAVIRNRSAVVPKFSSPFRIRSSVVWQDLLYRMGSSSRPPIAEAQTDLPEDRGAN